MGTLTHCSRMRAEEFRRTLHIPAVIDPAWTMPTLTLPGVEQRNRFQVSLNLLGRLVGILTSRDGAACALTADAVWTGGTRVAG